MMTFSSSSVCCDESDIGYERGPFDALADGLRELAEFVSSVGDGDYNRKSDLAGGATIGGHVRHCFDHAVLLVAGIEGGLVDYDRRERGTDVERCPHEAFDAIQRLEARIRELPVRILDRKVRVRGLVDPRMPAVEFSSTVGRELMFVISHTIHHNAMIAAAARRMGVSLPLDFGLAPATIAYRDRMACAPSPSSR